MRGSSFLRRADADASSPWPAAEAFVSTTELSMSNASWDDRAKRSLTQCLPSMRNAYSYRPGVRRMLRPHDPSAMRVSAVASHLLKSPATATDLAFASGYTNSATITESLVTTRTVSECLTTYCVAAFVFALAIRSEEHTSE